MQLVTCSTKTIWEQCLTSHEHNNVVNVVSILNVEQYLILTYLLTICLHLKNLKAGMWKYHARLVRPGPISFRTSLKFLFTCPWTSTSVLS